MRDDAFDLSELLAETRDMLRSEVGHFFHHNPQRHAIQ